VKPNRRGGGGWPSSLRCTSSARSASHLVPLRHEVQTLPLWGRHRRRPSAEAAGEAATDSARNSREDASSSDLSSIAPLQRFLVWCSAGLQACCRVELDRGVARRGCTAVASLVRLIEGRCLARRAVIECALEATIRQFHVARDSQRLIAIPKRRTCLLGDLLSACSLQLRERPSPERASGSRHPAST
jgi:hypothetical protein